MPIEIIVPRLGWSMEEGAFVAWLKKDGEFVRAGEALFSIEGDKAVQEIESIDSGILRIAANCPKPGDAIRVGDLLGHLLSEDEVAPRVEASGGARPSPGAGALELKRASEDGGAAGHSNVSAPGDGRSPVERSGAPPNREVEATLAHPPHRSQTPRTISPRALRVAAELGVDWTHVTGSGRSGRIREQDIRGAAQTRAGTASAMPASPGGSAVLVTGGCGFIGTWVVRDLLKQGRRVVVLDAGERPARWQRVIGADSEQVALVQGSLLDRALLARIFAEHRVAHVIHLAALLTPACQADPWEGCRVNVLGTVALFEQVRASIAVQGFSYASSVAVFGDEPDHASGPADSASGPPTFYGAFKKSAELIAEQYWRHFQIASVGIRPQVAYGPEREVGLTAGPSLAARAAARGEDFCINYTGRVGYDYVEDVARAFVRGVLETPPGAHVVDLPGEMADVNDVIAAIATATPGATPKLAAKGPPIPAHAPPNPRFISTLYPDWKATSLVEGMRRTVDFYRASHPVPHLV